MFEIHIGKLNTLFEPQKSVYVCICSKVHNLSSACSSLNGVVSTCHCT